MCESYTEKVSRFISNKKIKTLKELKDNYKGSPKSTAILLGDIRYQAGISSTSDPEAALEIFLASAEILAILGYDIELMVNNRLS